ncbi:MAG: RNA ligase family protein [Pirellulales bacterium]
MSIEPNTKPLGRKAYGSIGHLPTSRMGPGDHACPEGYAKICCRKARDKHDRIIVQEKLDGSCCAVAKVHGEIIPLGRAGWRAASSQYEQHQLFHRWVLDHWQRFFDLLNEGERIVGEWLAQAHGTRYNLWHEPYVPFDLMVEDKRAPFDEFQSRVGHSFTLPFTLSIGPPLGVESALAAIQENNHHGALDLIEGVLYRVERQGHVDFLAKYVRPDKVDGCYLPECSGKPAIWNWRPSQ